MSQTTVVTLGLVVAGAVAKTSAVLWAELFGTMYALVLATAWVRAVEVINDADDRRLRACACVIRRVSVRVCVCACVCLCACVEFVCA